VQRQAVAPCRIFGVLTNVLRKPIQLPVAQAVPLPPFDYRRCKALQEMCEAVSPSLAPALDITSPLKNFLNIIQICSVAAPDEKRHFAVRLVGRRAGEGRQARECINDPRLWQAVSAPLSAEGPRCGTRGSPPCKDEIEMVVALNLRRPFTSKRYG
jgi:hypothetical protein